MKHRGIMTVAAGLLLLAACGTRKVTGDMTGPDASLALDGSTSAVDTPPSAVDASTANDTAAPGGPFQLLTYQGPGQSHVVAVAIAPNGDVFVVGSFNGLVDLDPSAGTDNHTSVGGGNVGHGGPPPDHFVSRLRSDGVPIWTRILAGTGDEAIGSLVVDDAGAAIIAGWFNGKLDLDPGPGEDLRETPSNAEGFVMKLSPTGERVWLWTSGAGSYCRIARAGADLLVGGTFTGPTDFDPGPGTDLRTSRAGDAFVIRLNPDGLPVRPAWTFGGLDVDTTTSLGIGGDGSLYLAGQFSNGADFDPGPGQASLPLLTETTRGGYALALAAAGDLRWVGAYPDGVAVDIGQDAAALLRGTFHGEVDLEPGPGTDVRVSAGGLRETFVTKLTPTGGYGWTKTWTRPASQSAGISLSTSLPDGSVVLAGNFADAFQIENRMFFNNGNWGTFLMALSPDGQTRSIRAFGETERPSANPSLARFAMTFSLVASTAETLLVGGTFGGDVVLLPAGVATNDNGLSGFVARLPAF